MRKPVLISLIPLHIINQVKKIRISLGFTTRDIQKILELDEDGNILGSIESNFNAAKYHDKHLNKLAIAFTDRAHEQGKDITYTVADFYPPTDFEEKMVEKIIVHIEPTELKQTGTLHILLDEENDPFFDEWHSSKEIAHHCGSKAKKSWEAKDFTAVIDYAVSKDKLIRKSHEEALFKRP